ncbi:MAG: CCA tRNA nucleotidyltransferase, partial [Pseudolysinimonas sp.]
MESVAAAMDRLRDLASRPAVAELAALYQRAGHELALVGGTVRDAFLDRGLSGDDIDLDFTTDATPEQTEAIL